MAATAENPKDDKPVIVRVKRKASQFCLDAFLKKAKLAWRKRGSHPAPGWCAVLAVAPVEVCSGRLVSESPIDLEVVVSQPSRSPSPLFSRRLPHSRSEITSSSNGWVAGGVGPLRFFLLLFADRPIKTHLYDMDEPMNRSGGDVSGGRQQTYDQISFGGNENAFLDSSNSAISQGATSKANELEMKPEK
nr:RNA-directed DNA methylation 4 isoform X4 [Ipomoea batatas]